MAKGRKATPSKLLLLKGGTAHSHRPPRSQEPQPPEKMPWPPNHLDKQARKEWWRVGKILKPIGLMTELDRAPLAKYCEAYSNWIKLQAELKMLSAINMNPDVELINPSRRVEQYRQEFRYWKKAMDETSKGMIYKKKSGEPGFSPYLKIERDSGAKLLGIEDRIKREIRYAYEQMYKEGGELGLSPSKRASLKVETPKAWSKAEAFMDRKNSIEG